MLLRGSKIQKPGVNPISPGLLNTLQTGGGVFYPPPNSLVFYPIGIKLACRVLLVICFDFNFKIC